MIQMMMIFIQNKSINNNRKKLKMIKKRMRMN